MISVIELKLRPSLTWLLIEEEVESQFNNQPTSTMPPLARTSSQSFKLWMKLQFQRIPPKGLVPKCSRIRTPACFLAKRQALPWLQAKIHQEPLIRPAMLTKEHWIPKKSICHLKNKSKYLFWTHQCLVSSNSKRRRRYQLQGCTRVLSI